MVCKCPIKLRVATLIDFKLRDREYLMLPRPRSPDTVRCHRVHPLPDGGGRREREGVGAHMSD